MFWGTIFRVFDPKMTILDSGTRPDGSRTQFSSGLVVSDLNLKAPWDQGQGPRALGPGPGTRDQGTRALGPGPGTKGQGPRALGPGPGTKGQGPWVRVPGPGDHTGD